MALRPIVLLLLAALLAGCSDSGAKGDDDAPSAGDGEPVAGAVDANGEAPLPTWQVGQWWEWQAAFGSGAGPKFRSIVSAVDGSGYMLATENLDMAKQEAAFTYPILGAVTKDLGMEGWGGDWDLLDFPLSDGKTWTATMPNIAWDVSPDATVDLAMSATYDADLAGFRFMGHLDEGMVLEGTYLPATGWFGQLDFYDIDPGQEELEVGLTAVAAGLNYTGPVHTATAESLLVIEDGNGLDGPPPEGQPFVMGPTPTGTFTLGAGTTLYGYVFAESVLGTRVVTITDPANEQRQVVSSGDIDGDEKELFLDEPGIAGQWTVATSGAGGFSYTYIQVFEVTVVSTTL